MPDPNLCPSCSRLLDKTLPNCSACGLRLVGQEANELWTINVQIEGLQHRANQLIDLLHKPLPDDIAAHPSPQRVASGTHVVFTDKTTTSATAAPAAVTAPKVSLSGQHLLLGLGGFLVLAAVSFFLFVAWGALGIIGQTAIILGLAATSATAGKFALTRGWTAFTETMAVIAVGSTIMLGQGLRDLGVGPFKDMEFATHWAIVGVALAVAFYGTHKFTEHLTPEGEVVKARTYIPAAVIAAVIAAWSGIFGWVADNTLALSATTFALAVVTVIGLIRAGSTNERGHLVLPAGGIPLSISAVLAAAVYYGTAIHVGFDIDTTSASRVAATLLVAASTAAFAALYQYNHMRGWNTGIPVFGIVASTIMALSIVLQFATPAGWVAVGTVALLVAAGFNSTSHELRKTFLPLGYSINAVSLSALFVLAVTKVENMRTLNAEGATYSGEADWLYLASLSVITAITLTVLHFKGVLNKDARTSAALTHIAIGDAALWTLAELAGGATSGVVLVAIGAALVVASSFINWEKQPAHTAAFLAISRPAANAYSIIGGTLILFADEEWGTHLGLAFLAIAAAYLIYKIRTGDPTYFHRISIMFILAATCFAADEALGYTTPTEAYSIPLAALLAGTVWVQFKAVPTINSRIALMYTMTALIAPTFFTGISGEGDDLGLLALTIAGVAMVLVGSTKRIAALVDSGIVLAIAVGVIYAPSIASDFPVWSYLALAGVTLLAAGLQWERTKQLSMDGKDWYANLR